MKKNINFSLLLPSFSVILCLWTKLWESEICFNAGFSFGPRVMRPLAHEWANCSIVGSFYYLLLTGFPLTRKKKVSFLPSLDVGQSDIKCDFLLHTPPTCALWSALAQYWLLSFLFRSDVNRRRKEANRVVIFFVAVVIPCFGFFLKFFSSYLKSGQMFCDNDAAKFYIYECHTIRRIVRLRNAVSTSFSMQTHWLSMIKSKYSRPWFSDM